MKLQSKIKLILLFTIFFLIVCSANVFAASISVKPSKTSVSPGESFTVSISSSGATGKVSISASNGTVSPSSLWLEPSGSVTVKAGSSGSVKISVTAVDMSDSSGVEVAPSGSATVTIATPTSSGGSTGGSTSNKPATTTQPPVEVKKSTDNTLSALTIEEGQISPEFSKDVKEYAVRVAYEVTELNVTAKPNDSKAKVETIGNKDLQEGENVLTIRVTAEDGSVADYVVKVTRARIPLALKSLVIKYKNENGELIETALNPIFSYDVFEYSLEELEYWVKELSIEALPNIEGASVEVQGADSLQAGENEVTITAKISAEVVEEGEEPSEEIIEYKIKFNRKPEPTTMEKIHNWYNQNEEYIVIGALGICVVALFGLSIYIVVDYNKYKHIIKKVKEENDFKSDNIFEETSDETSEEEKDTVKTGKRFK